MPGLFSEFQLKDVPLRNQIAIWPMTYYPWHLREIAGIAAAA